MPGAGSVPARLMTAAGYGAAAFVPGPNFNYLTGLDFHLMERPTILFVTGSGDVLAIMPELERLKMGPEAFPGRRHSSGRTVTASRTAFADAAAALGDITVCVEGGRMRMFEYDARCAVTWCRRRSWMATGCWRPCAWPRMRRKSPPSGRPIAISEQALAETLEEVRPGVTEKEVQKLLGNRLLEGGGGCHRLRPDRAGRCQGGKSAWHARRYRAAAGRRSAHRFRWQARGLQCRHNPHLLHRPCDRRTCRHLRGRCWRPTGWAGKSAAPT